MKSAGPSEKSARGFTTVGILGGGQLGAMLSESLFKLGGHVAVYDPDFHAPALARTPLAAVGDWDDEARLTRFFSQCDVVTYEFENVETGLLRSVCEKTGVALAPSVRVLETTQNRISEKRFLASAGLPHAGFAACASLSELGARLADGPFPCIVKTARGGYDGKGQHLLTTAGDGCALLAGLEREGWGFFPCVVEELVPLEAEVSVIVARDARGGETAFPVFENVHANHILDVTLLPCALPASLQEAARDVALRAARALDVVGLLTVEFFVTRTPAPRSQAREVDGLFLYVNEFAPRPHNSGHVTRNACTASQFDLHARVLLGLPLAAPGLVSGEHVYAMGNLLGDVWLAQGRTGPDLDLSAWTRNPDVLDVVLYGKHEARAKRKMGHYVVRAPGRSEALEAVNRFRADLSTGPL